MSVQPAHHRLFAGQDQPVRHWRPVDQNDRNPQGSSRFQLGRRTGAARILGNDTADAVVAQQGKVVGRGKGPAGDDDGGIGQRQRPFRRVDEPQKIVVLRLRRKGGERLLADGQKDPTRRLRQGCDGRRNVGNGMPVIARARFPWRAFIGAERPAGRGRGGHGVAAHPRRERVRGVDDMGDRLFLKEACQPLGPAEAANARRQGLRDRLPGAARIGKDRVDARVGKAPGEAGRLGRSTQKKDAWHG